MNRNYFSIVCILALACLVLIGLYMWHEQTASYEKEAKILPYPLSPYSSSISAVGIVEPSSENILLASPVGRLVEKIFVLVGDKVKKGALLVELDNRDLQAELAIEQLNYESALAKEKKLEMMPRKEDVAISKSSLDIAKVSFEQARQQYEMMEGLNDPKAISQEERIRRSYSYKNASAELDKAEAEWNKASKGSWKPDLEIANLEALQAKANFEKVKTEIARTEILSPIDGTILQIKIHAGELPDGRSPLMIVGDIDKLNIRVSINQFDIPFFSPKAPASAFLQGDASNKFELEFIRVEPFLIDKQNLTNDILEKVDTRVLQVVYRIKPLPGRPLYVGQQMDVYIARKDSSENKVHE